MTTYFDIIMIPLQLLIVFFTIIILRFRSSGWFTAKRTKRFMKKSIPFAMVVCAHNEERVIGALVENLHLLITLTNCMIFLLLPTTAPTKLPKWHAKPVHRCMSVLTTPKRAKAMPWTGCLTVCSKWNASMTPCAFLTPTTSYTPTFKGNEQPPLQRRAPYSGLP